MKFLPEHRLFAPGILFIEINGPGGLKIMDRREPLAYRMCPERLEDFAGQEHILGEGKLLYRMIKADRLSPIILYGPPGTGKTALARVIAATTSTPFQKLNAVTSGVADIKRVIDETRNSLLNEKGRTVLFIDEIHRFNKAQQDALLPHVEDGTIILVGATTENPFFEVNKALISRSSVFMLKPLEETDILKILRRALKDNENGLGLYDIKIGEGVLKLIAAMSGGDARIALNTIELAVISTDPHNDGIIHINKADVEECMQKKAITFDKSGEGHYDNISAFIKSMRGSDPDAAVFYLARAIYAGEDPEFLARRIIICASEDVGMANPSALQTAVAAAEAVRMVGMPEARIILSHAAITVAASPKSNSAYMAISRALDDIASKPTGEVPMHLRNAVTEGMKALGYGNGYKYAHDFPGNIVEQQYLPDVMLGTEYYKPTANGYEMRVKEWLEKIRN